MCHLPAAWKSADSSAWRSHSRFGAIAASSLRTSSENDMSGIQSGAMIRPAIALPPTPHNEPVKDYAPGSPERAELQKRLRELERERIETPLVIGGKDVKTDSTFESVEP